MTYRIGMEVMMYVVKNAKLVSGGQGNITVTCPTLWDMSDEEFKKKFME